MEIRKVQKSGNSLYVTLPRAYLSHLGIALGDYVRLMLWDKKIDMEPLIEYRPEVVPCKKKKSRKSR